MDIKTKFSLNQYVYGITSTRDSGWDTCKTCNGDKDIVVNGEKFRCPKCYGQGGKSFSLPNQKYFVFAEGVIGKVEAEFYSNNYNSSHKNKISYMLSSTGVGSGQVWEEKYIFATMKEAQDRCQELNLIEKQKQFDEK